VPERTWKGAPHHAFRKGFKSGLLRAGAPPDAVDHLQGHVIGGSRGRYIDPMIAYDLVDVVGRVPRSYSYTNAASSIRATRRQAAGERSGSSSPR